MANTQTSREKGKCLCGKVSVEAEIGKYFEACHCGYCRKWSGGPLLAIHSQGNVEISPKENVSVYDSSAWAERGFCSTCGTHLFYRFKKGNNYVIPLGVFDALSGLNMDEQIFIDKKPDYYDFKNKTRNLTAQEVFEKYTG